MVRVQKHSNIVCQAIAEPQAKPVAEQEMRIANDVSELIGMAQIRCVHVLSSSLCSATTTLRRAHSYVLSKSDH